MNDLRDVRRCAVQALYQFDLGEDRPETVLLSLAESPGTEESHRKGVDLASLAWEFHAEADAAVTTLATDWPLNRQPVVDRSILRLAHYEMTRGGTPPKVVINEAVELAREMSTEKSHLFINGILDKLYRDRRADATSQPQPAQPGT